MSFFEAGRKEQMYFIAPHKEVGFDEAYIIAILFYWYTFLKKTPLTDSNKMFRGLKKENKNIDTNYFFWERE